MHLQELQLHWQKIYWKISTARQNGLKENKIAADGTVTDAEPMANDVLPIASLRRGEVPGIHSICYESEADGIIITHDAHNRKGFALGAVLAAEYTKEHSGLLSTNDLFKF